MEEDLNSDGAQLQRDHPQSDHATAADPIPPSAAHMIHIRDSTSGAPVDATQAEPPLPRLNKSKPSLVAPRVSLGTVSRLLIYAFEQLLKQHQLCQIPASGMFVTKLELRTASIHASLIRKIYITPSTILYEGPYREEKCAVTRHFEQYQDRFLRLTFRDEGMLPPSKRVRRGRRRPPRLCLDYGMLHDYNNSMSTMYERIKKILIEGANICDRHYEFLAFSSSQLREHSCWMFAPVNGPVTADGIRRWMGDFSQVRPVAKLAARVCRLASVSVRF